MTILYNILLYLLAPFIFAKLIWRGFKADAYWHRWPERLGFLPFVVAKPSIWIHAVSVGEAQAAVPLIKALRQKYPHYSIIVTCTTPTGSSRIRESIGAQVQHVYLPYDFPGSVGRFLHAVQPHLAIIMETELWPNLFAGCAQRNIPVIVANARLSPRSARRYAKWKKFTARVLANVKMIAAQSLLDEQRFIDIGARHEQVQVTGSIKFDVQISGSIVEKAQVLRRSIGNNRSVWICASTHAGEEEIILQVFKRLRVMHSDLVLMVVPRHPERFAQVAQLCRKTGFQVALKSEGSSDLSQIDIFVGDTMGDLPMLYAASDVAFVGGSLVPVGGHNLLEPAALSLAIVSGSQLFNFQEITQLLLEAGGLKLVQDQDELVEAMQAVLANPHLRQEMGEAAKKVVEDNRGALDRLMALVDKLMDHSK